MTPARPRRSARRERRAGPARASGSVPSEHHEQALLVARLEQLRPGVEFHAIPNGGHRHKKTAARLKAEGVKAGVPDLFVAEPRGAFHGLYLEMKRRAGGRASPAQVERVRELRTRGYAALFCRGADEAWAAVELYLDHPEAFEVLLG